MFGLSGLSLRCPVAVCALSLVTIAVAQARQTVIEVHEAADQKGKGKEELWYTVGIVDAASHRISWTDGVQYDLGNDPEVTVDDDLVIEVHRKLHAKSEEDERRAAVKYRVGIVDPDGVHIDWGGSRDLPGFRRSKIGVGSGTAFMVHEAQGRLCYVLGRVDRKKKEIEWVPEVTELAGYDPVIDLHGSSVVEIYEAEGQLRYRMGRILESGPAVAWSEARTFIADVGLVGDLSISYDGKMAVVVYASGETLFIAVGEVQTTEGTIAWSEPARYGEGQFPDIDVSDGTVVETHKIAGSRKESRMPMFTVGTIDPQSKAVRWGREAEGPRRAWYFRLD